jgi:hypothetical protein
MIWRIIRSRGFVPLILVLAALIYWKLHSSGPKALSVGYVADRSVILWNTLAQVHSPVGAVHYGDRVEIIRMEGTAALVRTVSGGLGWMVDSREIMDSELWGKSNSLLERARTLPVQARGRTKTVSNVRIEPGRDGKRIFQFLRGTPVLILERAVADAPQATDENSQEAKSPAGEDTRPKQEDWFLVLRAVDSLPASDAIASPDKEATVKRASASPVSSGPDAAQSAGVAQAGPAGLVAGWVLARFIELDLPEAVRDYASSADLRVVAWFELNRVPNGSGGEAPQYLVAGSRAGEVENCDFTMLRVYTWGKVRKRYETAFVESNLCGRLPIRVSSGEKGPGFQFSEMNRAAVRAYVMEQTVVRRVKDSASTSARSRR